jgi:tRNA (guanine-N7-)-methyltransferase
VGKKGKLEKFAAVTAFENCYEYAKELKGKWSSDVFKNDKPITVELACGKGEYTIGLAERFPDRNFIGIEMDSEYFEVSKSRIKKAQNTILKFT